MFTEPISDQVPDPVFLSILNPVSLVELSNHVSIIWLFKTVPVKFEGATGTIAVVVFPLPSLFVEHPKKSANAKIKDKSRVIFFMIIII